MEQLAVELRRSGAYVDLERAIPALYKCADDGTVTEAILDVVYSFPGGPVTRHLDVTVRCPFASAYKKTHENPAVAAQGGEDAKPLTLQVFLLVIPGQVTTNQIDVGRVPVFRV